ncbi:MAG: DUF480 domain-containing protein [Planctomycetaceae bacterium]
MLDDDPDSQNSGRLPVLTAGQRRVLGVLLEKGYTTPEYYPMTLKAIVSGCSQKSNRSPVVTYDPDRVQDVLDELRVLGLVAERHTESGRTVRFRHHMRQNVKLTEPQLAIMTELFLRGRQRLGELRTRVSRMVAIERQDDLRSELAGLIERDLVRSNGPLERRGIEVDHCLYDKPSTRAFSGHASDSQDRVDELAGDSPVSSAPENTEGNDVDRPERISNLEAICEQLTKDNAAMQRVIRELEQAVSAVTRQVQKLADEWND